MTMLRFLFRFFGLFLFAGAFVALIADGTRSIVDRQLFLTSTDQAIAMFSPDAASRWQDWLAALWPPLADPGLAWLLAQPAALVFGVLGLAFMAIGRPRAGVIRLARS